MDIVHLRTDGNSIQTGQLFAQQTALQTGMDGHHFSLLAVHLAVDLNHGIPQEGIFLILPRRIFTSLAIATTELLGNRTQSVQQLLLFLINGAADGEGQLQLLFQLRNTQIQAGLHQAGDLGAHRLHGIGNGADQLDQLLGVFHRNGIATQSIHIVRLHQRFRLSEIGTNFCLQLGCNVIDELQVVAQRHKGCFTATGNGVILGTAAESGQCKGHLLADATHELAHDLGGIGTVFMDLHAGVTTLQILHHQTDTRTIDGLTRNRNTDGGASATSTGNGKDTLFLRVDVQQHSTLQHGQIDSCSTIHTGLLVHSDHQFQGRMDNGAISCEGHSKSHGNTIVTTPGSAIGKNIIAVMGDIQALSIHIDGAIHILFTDHIHMTLDDHRGMILHAAGTGDENDDIVQRILDIFQALLLRKVHQVVADDLGIARAMGHGANFFKITKDRSRFQTCQFHSIHGDHSPLHGFSLF